MSLTELYNVRKVGAEGRRFAIGESGPSTAPAPQRCAICRAAAARYTCPRCQAPYCALTCFRAETHQACAAPFVDETLKKELGAQPDGAKASEEERNEMMELLRKLRAGALEGGDEGEEESDEEDAEDGTLELPPGVDLETASPETLLALLTPAQQAAFIEAVRSEKAEAVEPDDEPPWWESSKGLPASQSFTDAVNALKLPASAALDSMPPLAGNTIAVLLTYAHVVRALGVRALHTLTSPRDTKQKKVVKVESAGSHADSSPVSESDDWSDMPPLEAADAPRTSSPAQPSIAASPSEQATSTDPSSDPASQLQQLLKEERASQLRSAQAMLSEGVPFLLATEGEVARTRLESVEEACLALLASLGGGKAPATHLVLLLNDVSSILFPPIVEANVHPLHAAFADLSAAVPKAKRKLVYYAASWAAQQGKGREVAKEQLEEQMGRLEAELERALDEERWAATNEKQSEITLR